MSWCFMLGSSRCGSATFVLGEGITWWSYKGSIIWKGTHLEDKHMGYNLGGEEPLLVGCSCVRVTKRRLALQFCSLKILWKRMFFPWYIFGINQQLNLYLWYFFLNRSIHVNKCLNAGRYGYLCVRNSVFNSESICSMQKLHMKVGQCLRRSDLVT